MKMTSLEILAMKRRIKLFFEVSESADELVRFLENGSGSSVHLHPFIIPLGYVELKRLDGIAAEDIPQIFIHDLTVRNPDVCRSFLLYFESLVLDNLADENALEALRRIFGPMLSGRAWAASPSIKPHEFAD